RPGRDGPETPLRGHREIFGRSRGPGEPRACDRRGGRHDRRRARALSHPAGLFAAHPARARRDRLRLPPPGPHRPEAARFRGAVRTMTGSAGAKPFAWPIRVYYQHTDAGGVVFHANYLSFMECARTELLQSLGFALGDVACRDRGLFVVHSAQIAYHKPALLNELLTVTAQVKRVGRARLEF